MPVAPVAARQFSAQIQAALNAIGYVSYTATAVQWRTNWVYAVNTYLNFGNSISASTSGTNGYGFRDNAGTMQVKDSGGAWANIAASGGSAPADAQYWVGAASSGLSAEKNLGVLATAFVINTAGTPSAYAGVTCTNQLLRALSSVGAGNCASVILTADVIGILPGANGGTANGFFAVSGPTTSLKTFAFPDVSATVLTSNAAVTVPQGGTGLSVYAVGDLLYADTTTSLARRAAVAAGSVLISQGANTAPVWSSTLAITAINVSGATAVDIASGNLRIGASYATAMFLGSGNSRVGLGGFSVLFPCAQRSATTWQFRLCDDSADAPISASTVTASTLVTGPAFTFNGNVGGTGTACTAFTVGGCTTATDPIGWFTTFFQPTLERLGLHVLTTEEYTDLTAMRAQYRAGLGQ